MIVEATYLDGLQTGVPKLCFGGGRKKMWCYAAESNIGNETLDDYHRKKILKRVEVLKIIDGEMRIIPLEEDKENVKWRSVMIRCRMNENNNISNVLLEKIIPHFQLDGWSGVWMDGVEEPGVCTIEYVFFYEETAYGPSSRYIADLDILPVIHVNVSSFPIDIWRK